MAFVLFFSFLSSLVAATPIFMNNSTKDPFHSFMEDGINKNNINEGSIPDKLMNKYNSVVCLSMISSFSWGLGELLKWLFLSAEQSAKGLSCANAVCKFNNGLSSQLSNLYQMINPLKKCNERKAICVQISIISHNLAIKDGEMIGVLLENGVSYDLFKNKIVENPLFIYGNMVSPFLIEAREKLC